MINGVLWMDNQGSLEERLVRGASSYHAKLGKTAQHALVNAHECAAAGFPAGGEIGGLRVQPSNLVLPRFYLVGRELENA